MTYDIRNFRCSEGNGWDVCSSHSDEKRRWLDNKQKAKRRAEDEAKSHAEQRVDSAVKRGQDALKKYRDAEIEKESLTHRTLIHQRLIEKQNSGELWLYPSGKSPLTGAPGTGAPPKERQRIFMDENAPRR